MKVNTGGNIPIKMWLDDIEDGALEQAKHLAMLPFAHHHVAVMPDSHQGYGMPIGGVLATTDVIIPNAVGVDIGCGMCAVKTSLTDLSTEQIKQMMGLIRQEIPVGFNHHKEKQDNALMPPAFVESLTPIVHRQYEAALSQIGTLGGGNHFIEIQKGSDGHIWFMIHSGSRNLGLQVAKYYNELAVGLNARWHSVIPKEWELAFLPTESSEGQAYIREMEYCVDFALANRKLMMNRMVAVAKEVVGFVLEPENEFIMQFINIAHNYAALENHFGKNVWVHRKGATLARTDTIGIIPGSQGTKSYIVQGKGNEESFQSCSHGAGRKMGRKEAVRTLNLEAEQKLLNDQGIIHGIRHEKDLDEASGAYKSIETVMANQTDLVDVLVELQPLAVIKG